MSDADQTGAFGRANHSMENEEVCMPDFNSLEYQTVSNALCVYVCVLASRIRVLCFVVTVARTIDLTKRANFGKCSYFVSFFFLYAT